MIRASIYPSTATAGETGTWIVQIVCERDLGIGAAIRIQLPRSWHTTELNQAKGVHSLDATKENYVAVRYDSRDAHLSWYVEGGTKATYNAVNTRIGIDGYAHRYNYVVKVSVVEGILPAHSPVEIVFGDRRSGGPGFVAGLHPEGPEKVGIALDIAGTGDYWALSPDESPTLQINPSPMHELIVVVPSEAQVGSTIRAVAIGLDRFQNEAYFNGPIALRVVEGEAEVTKANDHAETARHEWMVRPTAHGVVRLEARHHRFVGTSNPIVCTAQAPTSRTYWGDLHSHAEGSYDATGSRPFRYARDVACLDFYALTEHTEGWGEEGPKRWARLRHAVAVHNVDYRFVTLFAYEATFDAPFGHHNVFFRDDPGDNWPLIGRDRAGTLSELWSSLTEGDAVTVPHHTGIAWPHRGDLNSGRSAPVVDWTIRDDRFRKLVEIYSSHGQSELYDPEHPSAYERMNDWSLGSYSAPGPHYAQDGWLTRQLMGTVAGSDNHSGQPGRHHVGLTAVICDDLTRGSIFDAMLNRRTYATTGARIVLRFYVDGELMGGVVPIGTSHRIQATLIGTDDLASVEVLWGDLISKAVRVVHTIEPDGNACSIDFIDEKPAHEGFYYLRAMQRRPIRGRAAYCWSSPVWIVEDTV